MKGGVMQIIIYTERFDEYAPLFSAYYEKEIEFRCVTEARDLSEADKGKEDVLILADPHMLEKAGASVLFADRRGGWSDVIIGSPENISSIKKEIKEMDRLKESRTQYTAGNVRAELSPIRQSVEKKHVQPEKKRRVVIGTAGLSPGAGASFLTMMLAEVLASEAAADNGSVTVLSVDDTYIYDALGLDKKFAEGSFSDIYPMRNGEHVFRPNVDEGISWAVAAGYSDSLKLLPAEKACIARIIPGSYILWDMESDDLELTLRQAKGAVDMLLLVIDPLPSALVNNMDRLKYIKNIGIPLVAVFNKWNDGVDERAVMDYVGIDERVIMPSIDAALVYRAEYECENPYRNAVVRRCVSDSMKELIRLITEKAC